MTLKQTKQLAGVIALCALGCAAPLACAQAGSYTLEGGAPGADAWVSQDTPEPGSDRAVMAAARRALAADNGDAAKAILDPWIKANRRTRNPFLAEAYLLRGDALLADNDEYQALFDYETVIRDFSASPSFAEAVEREYDIGRMYMGGLRRKFLGLRVEPSRTIGEELLIRTQERLPGSRLAERAALDLADHYYDRRDMALAADMYDIFLENFPESPQREYAALRQIYANVARFKGPEYDGAGLIEAQLLIEQFESRFPAEAERTGVADALAARIDESAAQQMLTTAHWYLSTGDEPSARFTMKRLLRRHPESAAAQTALREMIDRGWAEAPAGSIDEAFGPAVSDATTGNAATTEDE